MEEICDVGHEEPAKKFLELKNVSFLIIFCCRSLFMIRSLEIQEFKSLKLDSFI